MSHPFAGLCDEFHCNMRLSSQLAFPHHRETVLHFFEQLQKAYPGLSRFRKGEGHDFSIEEERGGDTHRWAAIEGSRLSSGQTNAQSIDDAMKLHELVLGLAPYDLGLSLIEIDHLDLMFGFDLEYAGNHDDIIAESLFPASPLACMLEIEGARPVDVQPTMTVAIDDDLRLQARLDIVTRTSTYQIRTGEYSDDAISVYLILRRYWGDRPKQSPAEVLRQLAGHAREIADKLVLPRVVAPIRAAIGSRS